MSYPAQVTRAISLFILLSLSGCSTWITGNFQDPDVRLVKVEMIKAKLTHQEFVLHFRIDNPNDSSLPIRGLHYKIHLNNVLLVEDETNDWFTVAANSQQFYKVRVRTNLWQHMKDIARMLGQPNKPIHYRLEGDLKTGLLLGHDLHLTRSGEIIPGDLIPE